jgi:hypothetical protein
MCFLHASVYFTLEVGQDGQDGHDETSAQGGHLDLLRANWDKI